MSIRSGEQGEPIFAVYLLSVSGPKAGDPVLVINHGFERKARAWGCYCTVSFLRFGPQPSGTYPCYVCVTVSL